VTAARVRLYAEATVDRGFGVIEIIVSMFLLALLAVAMLPLLMQSLVVASKNLTIAAATQVVGQQLEQLRANGSSCGAVKGSVAATPPVVPGPRGNLQPHLEFLPALAAGDVCQVPYLRTVTVHVWVTAVGSTPTLAEASKLILLDTP
jgi:type II secretory pathway pseudopilin PulG